MSGSKMKLVLCIALLAAAVPARPAAAAGREPALTHPHQALDYAGIYALKSQDPNLTGAGVRLAVICRSLTYLDGEPQNDYRPWVEHDCFSGLQFVFYDQNNIGAGISSHSTNVCSILFGRDPNAYHPQIGRFSYEGVVPDAQAHIHEFWDFLINNVFPACPPPADVVSASIGTQFDEWWTRGIQSMAQHHGLIIVAGIGNGEDAYDPPLYPAAGENVIGVGVVDAANVDGVAPELKHFCLAGPQHSSAGPVGDNRCKPDIVTAGNCLAAGLTEPNAYQPTGSFSSFATPIVSGAAALLVQKAKEDPNLSSALSPTGGNCVIKAILLNSATKLPFWHKGRLTKEDDHVVPLDYTQGAGALNALAAYQQLTAGRSGPNDVPAAGWDLNELDKDNPERVYRITIPQPADKLITATLIWNRNYDCNYPFLRVPEKDANLQLELWAADSCDPGGDYVIDYSDSSTDNSEHIYIPLDANAVTYEIVVSYSLAEDLSRISPPHHYALAWNVSRAPDADNILLYDLNTDGKVDDADIIELVRNWLASTNLPERYVTGDINKDGRIDFEDFQAVAEHIGDTTHWYTGPADDANQPGVHR